MERGKSVQTAKITISLPEELVRYADEKAAAHNTSRSRLIADLLSDLKQQEERALAVEGYCFYAGEAEEFAASSAQAVSEAIGNDSEAR